MFCKNCGKEMDEKAVVCTSCGVGMEKITKKKFYKKWWFWLIVILGIIIISANGGENKEPVQGQNTSVSVPNEVTYEKVDLKTLFDALKGNAMQAEEKYQGKYVEFSGAIANFDSDGSYISVEAVGSDMWDFDIIMCYVKTEEQKQILMKKEVGDIVTVRGKIKSIGEVLGYSLNMDSIE